MAFTAIRSHEICVAHRLPGHPAGCARIHGHNYVIELEVERPSSSTLDEFHMVMDFGGIKLILCEWLEKNWDHRLLLSDKDPLLTDGTLASLLDKHAPGSLVVVPFYPTAEEMGAYLVDVVFPSVLDIAEVKARVVAVTIHETGKCKVHVTRSR